MTITPRIAFATMVGILFKTKDYETKAEPLVHAAVGVMGESVELMFCTSAENFVEEAGDIEFYLEALTQSLIALWDAQGSMAGAAEASLVQEKLQLLLTQKLTEVEEVSSSDLVYFGNEILDLCKKLWIYKKPLVEVAEKLLDHIASYKAHLLALYETANLSEEMIRGANQEKLVYGENARYKDLAYSDKAAQERADKAGA